MSYDTRDPHPPAFPPHAAPVAIEPRLAPPLLLHKLRLKRDGARLCAREPRFRVDTALRLEFESGAAPRRARSGHRSAARGSGREQGQRAVHLHSKWQGAFCLRCASSFCASRMVSCCLCSVCSRPMICRPHMQAQCTGCISSSLSSVVSARGPGPAGARPWSAPRCVGWPPASGPRAGPLLHPVAGEAPAPPAARRSATAPARAAA
jgi:hypothetical protein